MPRTNPRTEQCDRTKTTGNQRLCDETDCNGSFGQNADGALIVEGGATVKKSMCIGGDLFVRGKITKVPGGKCPVEGNLVELENGGDLPAAVAAIDPTCPTTIKLACGAYCVPDEFGRNLKSVTICGDDRDIVGMTWCHGAKTTGLARHLIFGNLNPSLSVGRGTGVTLTISGPTISVSFDADAIQLPGGGNRDVSKKNPDFSEVKAGDCIGLLDTDGKITEFTIVHAQGNTITVQGHICTEAEKGVCMFIKPCVTIAGAKGGISDAKCLRIKGCILSVGNNPGFEFGSPDGYLEHCLVAGNLINRHNLYAEQPNTWLSTYANPAGSYTRAVFQGLLGCNATQFYESNPYSLFVFSAIAQADGNQGGFGKCGIGLGNGGQLCVAASDFFNCPTIAAKGRSGHFNLQIVGFCGNQIAVDLDYASCAYSDPLPGFPAEESLAPTFTDNVFAVKARSSTVVNIPGAAALASGNTTPWTTDGNSAVANDVYGARFSVIRRT